MKKSPEEVSAENSAYFMEHGPRLSSGYRSYVLARDTGRSRILLGGLGACGVGSMWLDEGPHHREYPGYEEAEMVDSRGGDNDAD